MCVYVYAMAVSAIHELLRGATGIFYWRPALMCNKEHLPHISKHSLPAFFLQGTATAARKTACTGSMGFAAMGIVCQSVLM